MRKIILAAAIAGAALTLAACSEGTEDAADDTAEGAMADTEANAEAMGEAIDTAADDTGRRRSTPAPPKSKPTCRTSRLPKLQAD